MIRPRSPLFKLAAASLVFMATVASADDLSDVNRLYKAGDFAQALNRADLFLITKPKDPNMRFLKGVILSEQGRIIDAMEMFMQLAEEFPQYAEPHNNLGVIYGKQGKYDKARASLQAAIRANPTYGTAYENLGDVYAKLASEAYSRAQKLDGRHPNIATKINIIHGLFSIQVGALDDQSAMTDVPSQITANQTH